MSILSTDNIPNYFFNRTIDRPDLRLPEARGVAGARWRRSWVTRAGPTGASPTWWSSRMERKFCGCPRWDLELNNFVIRFDRFLVPRERRWPWPWLRRGECSGGWSSRSTFTGAWGSRQMSAQVGWGMISWDWWYDHHQLIEELIDQSIDWFIKIYWGYDLLEEI